MVSSKTEKSSRSSKSTITFDIGDVCVAVKCQDLDLLTHLQNLYTNFLSQKPPDITIEFTVAGTKSVSEIKSALTRTRINKEGNHFAADEVALESEFDAAQRTLRMKVERYFFDPSSEFKLMNRILPLAYFTVCNRKHPSSPVPMLVHSSGVIRNGKVFLFTGPSEAGKTTSARLCSGEWADVLNDEMTLISRGGSGAIPITARGVPILGGLSQRLNTEAPLRCVFSIKQSKQTSVKRLSRVEAYMRFMRQIISPAYLGQTDTRALFSLIAEFADEVAGSVPFYELEFSLDRESLLQVLEDLEDNLNKEEKDGNLCKN